MSVPIEYLIALAAFGMLFYWAYQRRRRGSGTVALYLLLYDGSAYVLHSAKRDASGNIVAGNATYPAGVCHRVENESNLDAPVYVMAAEPLALAEHRTLEVARRSIVMGNIFKSGGELSEMLRLGAAGLVIAAALYVSMTINTFSSSLSRYDTQLQKVNDILSKPLVVAPGSIEPRSVGE